MKNHSKAEIEKIVLNLSNFPKGTKVLICLKLAKLVLPYWENYFDKDEEGSDIFRQTSVKKAIEITEEWVKENDNSYLIEAEKTSNQLWEDMEKVSFFCQEASGNEEVIKNRNKAFFSIECAYQTIQSLLWTETKIDEEFDRKKSNNDLNQLVFDVIEKQARKNDGAVFETAQAIQSARFVIENDEIVLKEIQNIIELGN